MKKKAILWETAENKRVRCSLCSHRCTIDDGKYGLCGVRKNTGGILYTYAYSTLMAANIDPVEKKPLYHVIPGSRSFSVATAGCNFKCSFCQNWNISQKTLNSENAGSFPMAPDEIVSNALQHGCRSISYTYTEPTVFFEYALETSGIAKEKGLKNFFVTNGFMTKEAIDMISPYIDAANVDLKFFNDDNYRDICGGRLSPVLDSIRYMREKNIWIEITTLIIPGKNDSPEELDGIASFIAGVGEDIPWHVSRFHPDYKYTASSPTPLEAIELAVEIAKKNGLKHIYPGNVLSDTGTSCPECGTVLIERDGFRAAFTDNWANGSCGKCGAGIPGLWE